MSLRLMIPLLLFPMSALCSGWGGDDPIPSYRQYVVVTCEMPTVVIEFSGIHDEFDFPGVDFITVRSKTNQFPLKIINADPDPYPKLSIPKTDDPNELTVVQMEFPKFCHLNRSTQMNLCGSGLYRDQYFDLRFFNMVDNQPNGIDIYFADLKAGIMYKSLQTTCSLTVETKPIK